MSTRASSPVYAVIGATGGIGAAVTHRLARDGAALVVSSRDATRAVALAQRVGGVGVAADATNLGDVEHLFQEARDRFGHLSGAVNCAGSTFLKPAHATSDSEWEDTLAANLTTAFNTVRAGAKALDSGASLVLVSSAAARHGFANHEAISAAKAGVIGLARAAAATYAGRGLRVNAVAPGLVRTPATDALVNGPSGEASQAMHPLARLGEPEDVASVISWLLHPEQGWVTGQVLGVDGGIATVRSRG